MPEAPKTPLSQKPVATALLRRDRLVLLRAAVDEPDPTRRNQTVGQNAARAWLGAPQLLTLGQAQALDPAFTLYAIASHPDPAEAPSDTPPPTWNDETSGNSVVLVQGLPGGSWASTGYLVVSSGWQAVDVDVTAGTYAASAPAAGTVTSVDGHAPDGAGNVELPASDAYPGEAKRSQVIGLFTSGTQTKAADAPLSGDARTDYLFAEFYDFTGNYWYKCLPNPTAPDGQGHATAWWVRR